MKQLSLGLVSDTCVNSSPQSGGVSGCNTPITILDAHTRNLQNTKGKHAEQPAKKRGTNYRIHVLPC
jgi:hypothetical protein